MRVVFSDEGFKNGLDGKGAGEKDGGDSLPVSGTYLF
jgi:hypothetical protein